MTVSPACTAQGGVCSTGVSATGGCNGSQGCAWSLGDSLVLGGVVSQHALRQTPLYNKNCIDTCYWKCITLPQTSFAGSNKYQRALGTEWVALLLGVVSTYVVCERLSVMPWGLLGVVEIFGIQAFYRGIPLFWTYSLQNTPPPENENLVPEILALWLFSNQNTPPLPRKLKFRALIWEHFVTFHLWSATAIVQ